MSSLEVILGSTAEAVVALLATVGFTVKSVLGVAGLVVALWGGVR
ncbi:MAG TPA: hypothetical protein VFK41_02045 [Nocardioidaceae bacterium]|nr:hypothetical protein [Nocardioidaceae bacterium]